MRLAVQGTQTAEAGLIRVRIGLASPAGIRAAVTEGYRYAVAITHVESGALRKAHRMKVEKTRGEIFIDSGATNPRSGVRVAEYAPIEHGRGGSHAFYARTAAERGARMAADAKRATLEQMP